MKSPKKKKSLQLSPSNQTANITPTEENCWNHVESPAFSSETLRNETEN